MNTLHVLNGDSTACSFANAGLPGDVAVWREMLAEGPLLVSPYPYEDLWQLRENWLNAQFGHKHQDQQPGYATYVVAEFNRISQYTDYDEVIFWFEHDLFCQINLVFLLASFAGVDLGNTVLKQVSVNRFAGMPDFKGLGELSGAQLATLYPQAETLTAYELAVAARVWQAYAISDRDTLTALLTHDVGRLRYLKAALTAHLARLPPSPGDLSLIENQLLALVRSSSKTPRQVVGEWLASDRIYGLGDWSIENYLSALIDRKVIGEQDGRLIAVAG